MLDALLDKSILFSFDQSGFRRHAARFRPEDLAVELRGKVCLVTGANSGLGLATSRGLAARGATVHLLCRDPGRGEAARRLIAAESPEAPLHLHLIDVADLGSVRRFVAGFGAPRVDVLVHNAGVLPDARSETADGLELTWATNVVGPFALTAGLLPRLRAAGGARVITVSSGGMYTQRLDLADPQLRARPFDGTTAYALTKRAEVVLSELWAERERGRVAFHCMHPGWADTPAVRSSLPRFYRVMRGRLRTAEEGADTILWLAACPAGAAGAASTDRTGPADRTGVFWFDRREAPTHLLARTRETEAERRALWALCEAQAGAAPPA